MKVCLPHKLHPFYLSISLSISLCMLRHLLIESISGWFKFRNKSSRGRSDKMAASTAPAVLPKNLYVSKRDMGLAHLGRIVRPHTAQQQNDASVADPQLLQTPPKPSPPPSPMSQQRWKHHATSPQDSSAAAMRRPFAAAAANDSRYVVPPLSLSRIPTVDCGGANFVAVPTRATVDSSTQHEVAAVIELLCTAGSQTDPVVLQTNWSNASPSSPRTQNYQTLLATLEQEHATGKTLSQLAPKFGRATGAVGWGGGGGSETETTLINEIIRQKREFESEKESLIQQLDASASENNKLVLRLEEEQKARAGDHQLFATQVSMLQGDVERKTDELTRAEVKHMRLEKTIEALEQEAKKNQSRTIDSTIAAMENHLKKKLEEATRQHRMSMENEVIELRRKKRELQSALDDVTARQQRRRSSATDHRRRSSTMKKFTFGAQEGSNGKEESVASPAGEEGAEVAATTEDPMGISISLSSPQDGRRRSSRMTLAEARRASKMDTSDPSLAAGNASDEAREQAAVSRWRASFVDQERLTASLLSASDEDQNRAGKHADSEVSPIARGKPAPAVSLVTIVEATERHLSGNPPPKPVATNVTRGLPMRRVSALRRSSSLPYSFDFKRNESGSDAAMLQMERCAEDLATAVKHYEGQRGLEALRSVEEQVREAEDIMHKHYEEQVEQLRIAVDAREADMKTKWAEEVHVLKTQLHAKMELIRQQHEQMDGLDKTIKDLERAKELVAGENTTLVVSLSKLQSALEVNEDGSHQTLCSMCHRDMYRTAVSLTHKYLAKTGSATQSDHGPDGSSADKSAPCPSASSWQRDARGGLSFGPGSSTTTPPSKSGGSGVPPSAMIVKPFSPHYGTDRRVAPFTPNTAKLRVVASADDPSLEPKTPNAKVPARDGQPANN